MDSQKQKIILDLSIKIVLILGLVIVITIIAWKLAASELYFDFTNFTANDILLIIISTFFLVSFWLFFRKILDIIEKKYDQSSINDDLINKLLLIITQLSSKTQAPESISDKKYDVNKTYIKLEEIYDKLNTISELIRDIKLETPKEIMNADILNHSKIQINHLPDHINRLLKKIISDNFEVSTLTMLPLEIFEFRMKKIINELDMVSVNELIQYEIIDNKKQLTEKGKSKLIQLTKSFESSEKY